MCARFTVDDFKKQIRELNRLKKLFYEKYPNGTFPIDDIFPKDYFPVLKEGLDKATIDLAKWGYDVSFSSKPIINTRSETIDEKATFKNDFKYRRCLILATAFYEWKKETKELYRFTPLGMDAFYMLGIYNQKNEFSIITTNANESMADIHHRMPIIIGNAEVSNYLKNYDQAYKLLSKRDVILKREKIER